MATTHDSADREAPAPSAAGAFDVFDECHRQTLARLVDLETIAARLGEGPADAQTRALAAGVVHHFSSAARQHHEDEERHVFPKLAAGADPQLEQAVLLLQQDHYWLEEDWTELLPHLDAVACGQSWYDAAVLRARSEIFAALSRQHIALEESCLYPAARALLRPRERLEMGREMAARRRPARTSAGGERPRQQSDPL